MIPQWFCIRICDKSKVGTIIWQIINSGKPEKGRTSFSFAEEGRGVPQDERKIGSRKIPRKMAETAASGEFYITLQ